MAINQALQAESRVAVLVDCDNTSPEVLEHALRVVAQFGRVVLRRGYGNHATLANKWQEALVRLAFTPCLQYQYAPGKNTSDIALALDAMEALFDARADTFCLVTSDSDFAYLCRKLRERGATVHIVGEAKSPDALRNASDQFFEWVKPVSTPEPAPSPAPSSAPTGAAPAQKPSGAKPVSPKTEVAKPEAPKPAVKRRPLMVVDAVKLMAADTAEGKVHLGPLGQYLKRTDPAFSPQTYGHSGLLDMLRSYDLLAVQQEAGNYWTVRLAPLHEATAAAVFNDPNKLGEGSAMVERLSNLVGIFQKPELDFSGNRAENDDILGDAYEYLMRHFATESGKGKGQFYTPSEVSRIIAKVIGIAPANAKASTTAYDPTCGSGSLLLKVAAQAGTHITLEGQEMDVATAGLARMNMILHDFPTASIMTGNTLSDPKFKDAGLGGNAQLRTYDYVVANPPFSVKTWSTGLTPANDPYQRFAWGEPPAIPACILVLDKERATARSNRDEGSRGVFMIDASKGFIKDGNKNRLREQDLHRIVDTFSRQADVPRYARQVALAEIADPKNDFNLNLPRYIDSSEPEDLQDITGHLRGGIPKRDLDNPLSPLVAYWQVLPGVRIGFFASTSTNPGHAGYARLTLPLPELKPAILGHAEFTAFNQSATRRFTDWRAAVTPQLTAFGQGGHPKALIENIAEAFSPPTPRRRCSTPTTSTST